MSTCLGSLAYLIRDITSSNFLVIISSFPLLGAESSALNYDLVYLELEEQMHV